MSLSPWRTLEELWREKALGEKKDQSNFATQRGKDLESVARDIYEFEFGISMPQANKTHRRFEYMRASLDGFNENERGGIEIKCPGRKDLEIARQGLVPEKYTPQIQWQLLVSDAKWIDYCSFDGKAELVVIKVYPDKDYQKDLVRLARWFWFHVRHKIELKPRGVMWELKKGML